MAHPTPTAAFHALPHPGGAHLWLSFFPTSPLATGAASHPSPCATSGTARLLDVTMSPDPSALPGGQVLQHLMNGIGGWALALSLVALLIGAAAWALGSHAQNYQQTFVGRRAVLISGLAALLIGAGPAIVNFFFTTGQSVH
jgi:Family of unknown function (DUF6112)